MQTLLVISIVIGITCAQKPGLPAGLEALAALARQGGGNAPINSGPTSSRANSLAAFMAKLQQLPATKTQSAGRSFATTPAPTTTSNPMESMLMMRALRGGGANLLGGGAMKMMMLSGLLGGGGGPGGGGGFNNLMKTTAQFRLCDEAELMKLPCFMCRIESFKRFSVPQFFTCNPMIGVGCCYKDFRSMMMAQQLAGAR